MYSTLAPKRYVVTGIVIGSAFIGCLVGAQIYGRTIDTHSQQLAVLPPKPVTPTPTPAPEPVPEVSLPKNIHRLPITARQAAKKLRTGMPISKVEKILGKTHDGFEMPNTTELGQYDMSGTIYYYCKDKDRLVIDYDSAKRITGMAGNGFVIGDMRPI